MTTQSYLTQAQIFRDAKPWTYINETHLFGIKRKNSEKIDWVITMGELGEHYGFGVYPGHEGLQSLIKINQSAKVKKGIADQREMQLSQSMYQVFFGNKNDAEKGDLKLYKEHSILFSKDKNQYIIGRRSKPYLFPTSLDSNDMATITEYMIVAMDIYEKIKVSNLTSRDERGDILIVTPDYTDLKKYTLIYQPFEDKLDDFLTPDQTLFL